MRLLLSGGAALTIVASIFLLRIVVHGYTDHGHLDVFHLIIAVAAASIGVLLLLRAFRRRAA
ncbi:MAG TPA: hypothetical protein VHG09_12415 [Longimicrobiales bacterium]|nr:hypothetical protein [Longimicrobiales bacterium]